MAYCQSQGSGRDAFFPGSELALITSSCFRRVVLTGGMRHPFFASERPLAFAHRGGSALAPENTFAAFDNGIALGADGLELDVQLSRDGVVMVHHDLRLDRTTNLSGLLAERTARELSEADAGWHFRREGAFPFRGAGCRIPILAEVLARFAGTRVIIELKTDHDALARAVVKVVRTANAIERSYKPCNVYACKWRVSYCDVSRALDAAWPATVRVP